MNFVLKFWFLKLLYNRLTRCYEIDATMFWIVITKTVSGFWKASYMNQLKMFKIKRFESKYTYNLSDRVLNNVIATTNFMEFTAPKLINHKRIHTSWTNWRDEGLFTVLILTTCKLGPQKRRWFQCLEVDQQMDIEKCPVISIC